MDPFDAEAFRRVRVAVRGPGLSLPTRAAIVAGAVVLTVVALLLVVPALFVGYLVWLGASAVAAARRRVRALIAPGGRDDGRRNVRVIARHDAP